MSSEWKPGDVAADVDNDERAMVVARRSMGCGERHPDEPHWHYASSDWNPLGVDSIRPLIVIDPDDREQVERLVRSFWDAQRADDGGSSDFAYMQAALRSLIAPPKPEEPGLWGVVEATVDGIPRRRWVHHEEDRWVCDTGERRYWDDLIDPVLIREGAAS